ncbi:uncharacterized protein LOC122247681 [Penaeus japonicus]|uniref:uncharacterized protein LOC122247681 n=1 Tax=Penaeus japonicus TaxID=27405 RepID=UPI001C717755|nr:uncharacterized protein LOC122247681 [Penaeus japonicus]
MRPITSGIGSAPYHLAKCLAIALSGTMGIICDSHLRNANVLIRQLQNSSCKNKELVSFDVKSLFTNVPTDEAIQAAERVVSTMDDSLLLLPERDFIELTKMCLNFGSFEFAGEEYQQVVGLAMSSPLSPVLSCLYVETLEKDRYRNRVVRHSTWLRYVDDVLVFVPRRSSLCQMLMHLNTVHAKIQFTIATLFDTIWTAGQGIFAVRVYLAHDYLLRVWPCVIPHPQY